MFLIDIYGILEKCGVLLTPLTRPRTVLAVPLRDLLNRKSISERRARHDHRTQGKHSG